MSLDKTQKIGFVGTADDFVPVFETFIRLAKELGHELTRDEKTLVAESLLQGKELTLEKLQELTKGKKILIIKDKPNESV